MEELFWQRFRLAEMCGPETIKGVAEASFNEYKDDIEGLTMLVMTINHKSWAHQMKKLLIIQRKRATKKN